MVPTVPLAAQPFAPDDADAVSAVVANLTGDTMRSGFPDAGSPSSDDTLPRDPFPPRAVYSRFLDADAQTLRAGQGYVSIGYAGGDFFAQTGDIDEFRPFILHAAYGVTDNLTLAIGSGAWDYEFETGGADTHFFPYVAPKLRVLTSGNLTASLGGRLVVPTAEDSEGFSYGVSVALSVTRGRHSGHLSLGVYGARYPHDDSEADYAMGIGGDVAAPLGTGNEFRLFGELRLLGVEDDDVQALTVGTRFLGGPLGGELGLAQWFGFDDGEPSIRPIVSLSYRF